MAKDIKKKQEEVNQKIGDAYNRLQTLQDEESVLNEELKQVKALRHRYAVRRGRRTRLATPAKRRPRR